MRHHFLLLLLALMPAFTTLSAQETVQQEAQPVQYKPTALQMKIGYFSYNEVLHTMSDYLSVQEVLGNLRTQYESEMRNAEKEFAEKYEAFLEVQHSLAAAIREKRQSELQNMMERNVAFKEEAMRQLAEAEEKAMLPVRERIADAIRKVGGERAYILIVNTDSNACPYLSPTMAEDITTLLKDILK